ncbi:Uncharacterized protein DAT39_005745 [Clarias magur]|uniref:Uncharacterized protein n=1 Tax=Clarias magur TaxID=1594786 RepID=A0A8J4USG5_CLAMG|nr:Uncharacterized protein DAT39_005745 [Clarias magur]
MWRETQEERGTAGTRERKEDGNSRSPSGENGEAHLLDIWFGGVRSLSDGRVMKPS